MRVSAPAMVWTCLLFYTQSVEDYEARASIIFTFGRLPRARKACQRSHLVCRDNQNSASMPVNAARRIAVSALTLRRPRTIALSRWKGTPMRAAASTWFTPVGSRNSFSNISPGWVGGRFFGNIATLSVVVLASDIVAVLTLEPEDDSILIIDADTQQPGTIALQGFESISWWHP